MPLGARLETFGLRPVSLLMAYDAGTAWLCTYEEHLGCGVHPVAGWPPPTKVMPREVALRPGLDYSLGLPLPTRFVRQWDERTDGFDGFFYVGPLTASWPAVKSEETRTDGRQAPPQ